MFGYSACLKRCPIKVQPLITMSENCCKNERELGKSKRLRHSWDQGSNGEEALLWRPMCDKSYECEYATLWRRGRPYPAPTWLAAGAGGGGSPPPDGPENVDSTGLPTLFRLGGLPANPAANPDPAIGHSSASSRAAGAGSPASEAPRSCGVSAAAAAAGSASGFLP